jgi:hypothetical protein
MISNKDFTNSNKKFIFNNIEYIIKRFIGCFSFETIDSLNFKYIIKNKIIELVSDMVSDFRKEDFCFEIVLNVDNDIYNVGGEYVLKIDIKLTHPYSEMIFKTKDFNILSRKLKIMDILDDGLLYF